MCPITECHEVRERGEVTEHVHGGGLHHRRVLGTGVVELQHTAEVEDNARLLGQDTAFEDAKAASTDMALSQEAERSPELIIVTTAETAEDASWRASPVTRSGKRWSEGGDWGAGYRLYLTHH